MDFWPKIGQLYAKFSKKLRIDKNPINGSYVQFLDHLVDFWPKNGNFSHFWKYREIQGNIGKTPIICEIFE